jgi:AraC family transcriptional regulator
MGDGSKSTSWSEVRYSSPLVTVMRVTCDLKRSGPTSSYHVGRTWIGLPLSGIFSVHARHEEHLIHPALGVVFAQGIDYQMSHPTDDGDTSVALGFAPYVVEEGLPTTLEHVRVTRLDLRLRNAVGVLLAAIARPEEAIAVDDLALDLLRQIAANLAPTHPSSASSRGKAKVDRIRAILAERPEAHWTLGALAELINYSPFHLAHQFRAYTGTSVHQYLADLRSVVALNRIEAGETSLATVAADLGFSDHSHLTATLRQRLGVTPQMIRKRLRIADPT